jgi:hypothetical protein
VSGNTVYVGGTFANIGGQFRNNIAALDITTGAATAWNPSIDGPVYALSVSGKSIYIGGDFRYISGQARKYIAALNATDGTVTSWNPKFNGRVNTLTLSGNTVYAGGEFSSLIIQARNNLAAFDLTSGAATDWNPNVTGTVEKLFISDNTIYIGGEFTSVGEQPHTNIAALDLATGAVTAWNPKVEHSITPLVFTIWVNGNTVYIGGRFDNAGRQPRNNIAALDATTGIATPWNPDADSIVYTLATSTNNTIYVGGLFTHIGGLSRNRIAALDATTGVATPWNPDAGTALNDPKSPTPRVRTVAVKGNIVYAGGDFVSIHGQPRAGLAAIDLATGVPTTWNPGFHGNVYALAFDDHTIYTGDGTINGDGIAHIAGFDTTTGAITFLGPTPVGGGNGVGALTVSGNIIYIAGFFDGVFAGGAEYYRPYIVGVVVEPPHQARVSLLMR